MENNATTKPNKCPENKIDETYDSVNLSSNLSEQSDDLSDYALKPTVYLNMPCMNKCAEIGQVRDPPIHESIKIDTSYLVFESLISAFLFPELSKDEENLVYQKSKFTAV